MTAPMPAPASPIAGPMIDLYLRIGGWCLFMLLLVAYVTGEEFQHTHGIIGYGIVVLLVARIAWALLRPHEARFEGQIYDANRIRALLRTTLGPGSNPQQSSVAVVFAIILPVLALLALAAVTIMFVTHNFWGPVLVDEMHEVVAYFALGLLAFYAAIVVIASHEHVSNLFRSVSRR